MYAPSDVDILIVEDNPRDAELTIHTLQKRNVTNRIEWAKDGAAALAFVFGADESPHGPVHRRPKVILLDLRLPKIDGLEVLRRLKTHDTAKSIPVVVLSSSSDDPDIVRSFELGVNSYIVKPVSFENFSEAVAQLGLYWMLLNERPERHVDVP